MQRHEQLRLTFLRVLLSWRDTRALDRAGLMFALTLVGRGQAAVTTSQQYNAAFAAIRHIPQICGGVYEELLSLLTIAVLSYK